MLRRQHKVSNDYHTPEPDLEALVVRIRRLVLHRGFDRSQIDSPLLKRFTPSREAYKRTVETGVRQRLKDAKLDAGAVNYLLGTAEIELDEARLRLT